MAQANTSAIVGFKPIDTISGRPWQESIRKYLIHSDDGTATFVGDLVKITGTADPKSGRPKIAQAAASSSTAIHVGVVVGFDPVLGVAIGSENFNRVHRPASTAMYALVCDSPDVIYQVQADDTGVDLDDVGSNFDIIVGSGSTTTGYSAMQLDSSTVANTGTLPLKLVGFMEGEGYVTPAGDDTLGLYAQCQVIINSHWLAPNLNTASAD